MANVWLIGIDLKGVLHTILCKPDAAQYHEAVGEPALKNVTDFIAFGVR